MASMLFPDGRAPEGIDAALGAQLGLTVAAVRTAASLLSESPMQGGYVIGAPGPAETPGPSATGAAKFVELCDNVANLRGAKHAFSKLAIAVYGLWIFPGIRRAIDPTCTWTDMESDILGTVMKENRRSVVDHCALHPVEIILKYGPVFFR